MARPETALSKSELLAACRCFQTGRRLGNRGYAQSRQLSCGATGEVYFGRAAPDSAAFEILHGGFAQARQVALKHMRSINAGVQRQIQQEISTVFRCRAKYAEEVQDPQSQGHPNLVAYLDWFAGPNGLDREVYLVMEFCPFSLADMIFVAGNLRGDYEKLFVPKRGVEPGEKKSPQCHRFPESEVVKVLCDLLNALNFLNRQGLAHRDVKTENILWAEGCYKLADFGTATMLEAAIPRTNECGTLWIMAPELLGRRPHGLNCDVWSLGVVLFEVTSFGKPFNSKELLAYRNSSEAAFPSSFWPFLCAGPVSSPAKTGGKTLPRLKSGPELARTSSRGARPQRTKCRSVTLPPLLISKEAEVEPDSPTSQSPGCEEPGLECKLMLCFYGTFHFITEVDSHAASGLGFCEYDPFLQQRFAFLRKRLQYRWCYSEELRSLIFEDMLREEPELRPIALELWQMLQTSRFETLAQQAEAVEPAAEGNTKEELLRSVCPTNMLRAMNLAPTQGGYLSTASTS
ncbi:unnamed protein product [Durusdinium trenchii]|uniref:non-specific serine/threonine protein kinase n=1 Tax=Durusdinium trenchii TaxID=1381693 RepID=A0ABP0RQL3_9DINO